MCTSRSGRSSTLTCRSPLTASCSSTISLIRPLKGEWSDGPTSYPLSVIPERANVRNAEKFTDGSESVSTFGPSAQPPAASSHSASHAVRNLKFISYHPSPYKVLCTHNRLKTCPEFQCKLLITIPLELIPSPRRIDKKKTSPSERLWQDTAASRFWEVPGAQQEISPVNGRGRDRSFSFIWFVWSVGQRARSARRAGVSVSGLYGQSCWPDRKINQGNQGD